MKYNINTLLFAFFLLFSSSSIVAAADVSGVYAIDLLIDDNINPPEVVRGGFVQIDDNNGNVLVTVLPINRNGDYTGLNHHKWFSLVGNYGYIESVLDDASQGWVTSYTDNSFHAEIDYCIAGTACDFIDVIEINGTKIW